MSASFRGFSLKTCREKCLTHSFSKLHFTLALSYGSRGEIVDALCDILYVTYGYLDAMGIDGDKAFSHVQKSNMSKLGEDGKPIYRPDGKVLKGPNYKPPYLDDLIIE